MMGGLAALVGMIGTSGTVELGGVHVAVTVTDVRNVFGRDDYRVTPTAGRGQVWIAADRFRGEVAP